MRDPERIKRIIHKLEQYWLGAPDLRLCQLVVNLAGTNDPYNVEDTDFECRLTEAWVQRAFIKGPSGEPKTPILEEAARKAGIPIRKMVVKVKKGG